MMCWWRISALSGLSRLALRGRGSHKNEDLSAKGNLKCPFHHFFWAVVDDNAPVTL